MYLGIFTGFLITIAILLFAPIVYALGDLGTTLVALSLSLPAMIDWSTQRLALRESRNGIRFWTALPTGFALSWYLLSPVSFIVKIPVLIGVLIFIAIFGFIDRRPPYEEPTENSSENMKTLSLQP